jgi:hypothetical protein
MLLKFKYIKEYHIVKILSGILITVLNNFNIRDRILAVTIDNVSNNNTLIRILNKKLRKSVTEIFNINLIFHILYLAHIIQLAVKIMIGRLKIEPKNNLMEVNWEKNKAAEEIKKATEIISILIKIYHDQYNDLIILTKFFY